MAFQSINEIEKFSYEDAQITEIRVDEVGINMEFEALIVRPNNSQNTNYTESYAGTTTVRLIDGKIVDAVKEGYRFYDANDVLQEEVPDKPLSKDEIEKVISSCKNAYVIDFYQEEKNENEFKYSLGIEVDEDNAYWFVISFSKSIFTWERYMNRVQR